MAIFASLFALIGRFFGKLLTTLVGVATSALVLLDLIFAARRPASRRTRRI